MNKARSAGAEGVEEDCTVVDQRGFNKILQFFTYLRTLVNNTIIWMPLGGIGEEQFLSIPEREPPL